MGHTCGEPNETELAIRVLTDRFTAPFQAQLHDRDHDQQRRQQQQSLRQQSLRQQQQHGHADGGGAAAPAAPAAEGVVVLDHDVVESDRLRQAAADEARVPIRSISPLGGLKSIRLRPLIRTYAPWGRIVRADELAKSRNMCNQKRHP